MNIRFQGNYNVIGSNRQAVQLKMNELDNQSQLAIGTVAPLNSDTGDHSSKSYGGFLLTDDDAVTFLQQQGMDVSLAASRDENESKIQQGLAEKKANGTFNSFMEAICMTSYMLRFTEENITEILLK